MNKENFTARFGDAPWFGKKENIVIGGAGGIGSWVALALTRVGHEIIIFDDDTFEDVNMAGQLCSVASIGKSKVSSLNELIELLTGNKLKAAFNSRYNGMTSPIMIAAFDNMVARKLMFEEWSKKEDRKLFIDGRMTAEHFEVYAVLPGNEKAYEETLFSDEEANTLKCSFKATTHNAMGIAYIITGIINNLLSEDPSGLREVPFKTEMNISLFMFETK